MEYAHLKALMFPIVGFLEIVEEANKDVLQLSEQSAKTLHQVMEGCRNAHDSKTLHAFQCQDVISQQLRAVHDAAAAMRANLQAHLRALNENPSSANKDFEKLAQRLLGLLGEIQWKRGAFMGNALDAHNAKEVEFF